MRVKDRRTRLFPAAGVALVLGTLVAVGPGPASAQATESGRAASESSAAQTLDGVDRMLAEIGRTLTVLRDQADEALLASRATTDLDAADRQMRLHFELSARVAEIEALESDLRRQADLLRASLDGEKVR